MSAPDKDQCGCQIDGMTFTFYIQDAGPVDTAEVFKDLKAVLPLMPYGTARLLCAYIAGHFRGCDPK